MLIPAFPGTNCEVDTARAAEDAGAKAFVEGGINIVSKEFNDYDETNKTVRLHIVMDKGANAEWGVKHAFTIKLVVGDKTYEGVVNFAGNALVNVTPIPEALPDPIETVSSEGLQQPGRSFLPEHSLFLLLH